MNPISNVQPVSPRSPPAPSQISGAGALDTYAPTTTTSGHSVSGIELPERSERQGRDFAALTVHQQAALTAKLKEVKRFIETVSANYTAADAQISMAGITFLGGVFSTVAGIVACCAPGSLPVATTWGAASGFWGAFVPYTVQFNRTYGRTRRFVDQRVERAKLVLKQIRGYARNISELALTDDQKRCRDALVWDLIKGLSAGEFAILLVIAFSHKVHDALKSPPQAFFESIVESTGIALYPSEVADVLVRLPRGCDGVVTGILCMRRPLPDAPGDSSSIRSAAWPVPNTPWAARDEAPPVPASHDLAAQLEEHYGRFVGNSLGPDKTWGAALRRQRQGQYAEGDLKRWTAVGGLGLLLQNAVERAEKTEAGMSRSQLDALHDALARVGAAACVQEVELALYDLLECVEALDGGAQNRIHDGLIAEAKREALQCFVEIVEAMHVGVPHLARAQEDDVATLEGLVKLRHTLSWWGARDVARGAVDAPALLDFGANITEVTAAEPWHQRLAALANPIEIEGRVVEAPKSPVDVFEKTCSDSLRLQTWLGQNAETPIKLDNLLRHVKTVSGNASTAYDEARYMLTLVATELEHTFLGSAAVPNSVSRLFMSDFGYEYSGQCVDVLTEYARRFFFINLEREPMEGASLSACLHRAIVATEFAFSETQKLEQVFSRAKRVVVDACVGRWAQDARHIASATAALTQKASAKVGLPQPPTAYPDKGLWRAGYDDELKGALIEQLSTQTSLELGEILGEQKKAAWEVAHPDVAFPWADSDDCLRSLGRQWLVERGYFATAAPADPVQECAQRLLASGKIHETSRLLIDMKARLSPSQLQEVGIRVLLGVLGNPPARADVAIDDQAVLILAHVVLEAKKSGAPSEIGEQAILDLLHAGNRRPLSSKDVQHAIALARIIAGDAGARGRVIDMAKARLDALAAVKLSQAAGMERWFQNTKNLPAETILRILTQVLNPLPKMKPVDAHAVRAWTDVIDKNLAALCEGAPSDEALSTWCDLRAAVWPPHYQDMSTTLTSTALAWIGRSTHERYGWRLLRSRAPSTEALRRELEHQAQSVWVETRRESMRAILETLPPAAPRVLTSWQAKKTESKDFAALRTCLFDHVLLQGDVNVDGHSCSRLDLLDFLFKEAELKLSSVDVGASLELLTRALLLQKDVTGTRGRRKVAFSLPEVRWFLLTPGERESG